MKPPRRRPAEVVSHDGLIEDYREFHRITSPFVSGRSKWWAERAPELAEAKDLAVLEELSGSEQDWVTADIKARRAREAQRIEWLLDRQMLAGEALRAALRRESVRSR